MNYLLAVGDDAMQFVGICRLSMKLFTRRLPVRASSASARIGSWPDARRLGVMALLAELGAHQAVSADCCAEVDLHTMSD